MTKLGIELSEKKKKPELNTNKLIGHFYWFLYRVFNKLKIYNIRDRIFRVYIKNEISSHSDETLIAMIGDKSHKLLQQALGQKIKGNQYYLEQLFHEAQRRNVKSKIYDWGLQIYNDYLNNDVYKYIKKGSSTTNLLDIDRLDNYLELLKGRQSIRKFLDEEISDDIIKKLLTCGIHAPCSCNTQSWKYITFTNKIDKQYIAQIRGVKFLEDAPLIICVLIDIDLYTSNTQGDVRITPIMDGSASIMNIITACEAIGLASCWVNFVASVKIENMTAFRNKFNIPVNYVPISLIAIGRHISKHNKPARDDINKYWFASY